MRNVDITPVCKYTMSSGIGSIENNQACVMAQAAILDALDKGRYIGDLTDELECACPVLRGLAIALNDVRWWESDIERTRTLRPLLTLILDSRREPDVTAKRAALAAGFAQIAAKYAEAATKSAMFAAESAAESAKYAKYAAADGYQIGYLAMFAAESAEWAARYAKCAAQYAAMFASVEKLKPLRDELLRVWMACEALQ
jgi:F0F1-type ATP synthase epsilon subunit